MKTEYFNIIQEYMITENFGALITHESALTRWAARPKARPAAQVWTLG